MEFGQITNAWNNNYNLDVNGFIYDLHKTIFTGDKYFYDRIEFNDIKIPYQIMVNDVILASSIGDIPLEYGLQEYNKVGSELKDITSSFILYQLSDGGSGLIVYYMEMDHYKIYGDGYVGFDPTTFDPEFRFDIDNLETFMVCKRLLILFDNITKGDIKIKTDNITNILYNINSSLTLPSQNGGNLMNLTNPIKYGNSSTAMIGMDCHGSLKLIPINVNPFYPPPVSWDLFYGKGFEKYKDLMSDIINNQQNGIHILSGLSGTGKSRFVSRAIEENLFENKLILFIQYNLLDKIDSPTFISYISALNYANSDKRLLIIVENFDRNLNEEKKNNVLQKIFNYTESVFTYLDFAHFIFIFNDDKLRIDKNLIQERKISSTWFFDRLSIKESQELYDAIYPGIPYNIGETKTLKEIFFIQDEINATSYPYYEQIKGI